MVKYLNYLGYEHYNFSFPLIFELKKIIKNYDLVHITAVWNFPVLAGSHLARKFNKPYVISPRGTMYKETIELKSKFAKKLYYKLFIQQYLNTASCHVILGF